MNEMRNELLTILNMEKNAEEKIDRTFYLEMLLERFEYDIERQLKDLEDKKRELEDNKKTLECVRKELGVK